MAHADTLFYPVKQIHYLEGLDLEMVHQTLLASIPRGEEEYIEGVRRMYGYLYSRLLASSGKRLFLDKTPLYYCIIPELHATFPAARFLILFRNPLAVMSSILRLRIARRWIGLREWKDELIDAPARLVKAIELLGPNAHVVHYEALVTNPEIELQSICNFLGISFIPEMTEYGSSVLPKFTIGDPVNVYKHGRPTMNYTDTWQEDIHDPQVWKLLSDYLDHLGPEILGRMGYSHGELRSILDTRRPLQIRLAATLPLNYILRTSVDRHRSIYYDLIRVLGSLRRRGVYQTARMAFKNLRSYTPIFD